MSATATIFSTSGALLGDTPSATGGKANGQESGDACVDGQWTAVAGKARGCGEAVDLQQALVYLLRQALSLFGTESCLYRSAQQRCLQRDEAVEWSSACQLCLDQPLTGTVSTNQPRDRAHVDEMSTEEPATEYQCGIGIHAIGQCGGEDEERHGGMRRDP